MLEEAIQEIQNRTKRITEKQEMPVYEAGGYLLAEDIYAPMDNPPFSRAPIDGYAVRSEDLQGASQEHPAKLKVIGCIYAGDSIVYEPLRPGEAYRIMTGAPFPAGSDTAVRQEETDYGEEEVQIYVSQQPYMNYCFQGEDYKQGSILLVEGTRITFAEQGILAGIGRTHVKVYRKPVVRVITTGDELVPAGTPLSSGKIYDSNAMMVASRIKELGICPASVEHCGDSGEGLAKRLKEASQDADIIVTTGGVSVGKKDILHEALPLMGAEKVFWRVLLQPGTPTIFSVYENTLILSLSGNPFGAMANVELLLRPMLAAMTGDPGYKLHHQTGIFRSEFPKKSKGRRFVRAIYYEGQVALPQGLHASGGIGTLRGCNCLLDIPAGTPGLFGGEEVTVWML